MPKKIQKSLRDYLSKIKSTSHPQIQLPSKKWVLSSCKHPKTPSFSLDDKKNDSQHTNNNNKKDDEATLADIDHFLFENFKSLYLKDDEEANVATTNKNHNPKRVSKEERDDSDNKDLKPGPMFYDDTPIDLRGSNRLFMTHGFSGSFMETTTGDDDEAGSSSTSITYNDSSSSSRLFHYAKGLDHDHDHKIPENCVAVLACSESPYEDFKHSMQGMVEARLRNNERVDWDFMEEILFCHINLNEKKSYKFILSAFVDLITAMRQRPKKASATVKPQSVRNVRIGREVRKRTKEVTVEFGPS